MKLKKLISLLMCTIFCIVNFDTTLFLSFADDVNDVEMVYVSSVVNGISYNLQALKNKDGILLFSGKTLSNITVYNNTTSPMLFQHDKATEDDKYREILISKDNLEANLVSFGSGQPIVKKITKLPDIINYEDEWYYPVVEMLPLLNTNATVSDNKLIIEDVPYSMSNIMPDFNISDYMFNLYDIDAKILSGYSYLFNGLVDFELKKFVPIIGWELYNEETYEEIFTSYLAEDEVYFDAIGDEEHCELPMINYLLDDDSERINAVIEGMKASKDIIKDYSGYDISTEDIKMIKSSAELGEQLEQAIKLYSFAAIYTDHVTDHYEMLDAIYNLDYSDLNNVKVGLQETSYIAAQNIYDMYSDTQQQAIANYIGKQIENKVKDMIEDEIKESISNELSLGKAFAWSKLGASLMKAYFIAIDFPVYNVSRKCENLMYYNRLMERGESQFWAYNNSYDNISMDNIEKARLSAIFALISSRSMYQALLDSEKAYGNSGNVYQRKIDSINSALRKMYQAKNCCTSDSEEYIDKRINELKQSIADISTVEISNNIDTFEMYKAYFLEHYSMDDLVCLADVTHDGIDEMIVITDGDFKGDTKFSSSIRGIVYTISNDSISQIHEKNGSAFHAANFFNWYLTENGNLQEDLDGMWQGRGELNFYEYYLTSSGERVDIENIILSNATSPTKADGTITDEAYQEFINNVNSRIENSYLLFSTYDFATVSPKYIELNPRKVFNIDNETNFDSTIESLNISAMARKHDGLELRKSDSADSNLMTIIPYGENVRVISLSNKYKYGGIDGSIVKIKYNDMIGYVNQRYLLIDNTLDINSYSEEKKLLIGSLLYTQYNYLWLDFLHNGGIFDCSFTGEYSETGGGYEKIEPKGLTIDQLIKDYQLYYTDNVPLFYADVSLYKEEDGYLWRAVGFGGDPSWEYDEVVEVSYSSKDKISYKVIHHILPSYYEHYGYDKIEETFSITSSEGRWKCDEISTHI